MARIFVLMGLPLTFALGCGAQGARGTTADQAGGNLTAAYIDRAYKAPTQAQLPMDRQDFPEFESLVAQQWERDAQLTWQKDGRSGDAPAELLKLYSQDSDWQVRRVQDTGVVTGRFATAYLGYKWTLEDGVRCLWEKRQYEQPNVGGSWGQIRAEALISMAHLDCASLAALDGGAPPTTDGAEPSP